MPVCNLQACIIDEPTRNFPRIVLDMHRIKYQRSRPPPLSSFPSGGGAAVVAVVVASLDVACAKSNIVSLALLRCIDTPPVDTKCGIVSEEGWRTSNDRPDQCLRLPPPIPTTTTTTTGGRPAL